MHGMAVKGDRRAVLSVKLQVAVVLKDMCWATMHDTPPSRYGPTLRGRCYRSIRFGSTFTPQVIHKAHGGVPVVSKVQASALEAGEKVGRVEDRSRRPSWME